MTDRMWEDRWPAWNSALWAVEWEGGYGEVGGAHFFFGVKCWPDGTVDVVVVHDPYRAGIPTAYGHRHGAARVTPLTVHGPVNEAIKTVLHDWKPPQVSCMD